MSLDVDAVVKALFAAGVERITVKDFHRTAYNLLPMKIDKRARLVSGYRMGPVPGVGNPEDADAVMMIGMHAASGTNGFLAHTLTSRLAEIILNGRPLAEVELFAASLGNCGLAPIFFSGCPVACAQARERIQGIQIYAIDKQIPPSSIDVNAWREGLARSAAQSLSNTTVRPYQPQGPFHAEITIRDGPAAARKMAAPWGLKRCKDRVFIDSSGMDLLYDQLIRLCYLSPTVERALPASLLFYNLIGWLGQLWVRWETRRLL